MNAVKENPLSNKIYVWDLFVRTFHWSLVTLFIVSYFTGEEEHWVHVYSGYVILTLLTLRILWGFIGSKYARFSNFIYPPGKVAGYLRSLMTGDKSERYLGHNPAGGLMFLAMIVMLVSIGFSGLKLYAIEEGKGPLADNYSLVIFNPAYAEPDEQVKYSEHDEDEWKQEDDHEDEEAEGYWEDVHEASVNFMILLIMLHLGGVFLSGRRHQESLVKGMLTGYKDAC